LNKQCGAAGPLSEDEEHNTASQERDGCVSEMNEACAAERCDGATIPDATCGTNLTASVLSVTPGRSGSVVTVSPGYGIRSWAFSNVLGDASSQYSTYETCGMRLVVNLVNGQSGALIVYGQTGSGKTHTMFGAPTQADGLVPQVANDILNAIETRRSAGFTVELRASFVEVFGNDINNLLGNGVIGANRGQHQRMAHRFVLDGQCEEVVSDVESFADLLKRGEETKRKASTEMNERSTRAHTLVILRLRQCAPEQQTPVESILTLVDLGGSERLDKSKANEMIRAPGQVDWQEYYRCRERVTETNNINQGLLALKRCVLALNKRQRCAQEGRMLPRVPFSDSKLTMLLEPALNGEAHTSIVVCCAPEDRHAEETVQSLRFGEICRSVQHEAAQRSAHDEANEAVKSAVQQIDADIREVEAAIRSKERWEWRTITRVDVIDEKDTGGTVVNHDEIMELGGAGAVAIAADDGTSCKRTVQHEVRSQVLVGAEAENARRDDLLRRRAKLLGGAMEAAVA